MDDKRLFLPKPVDPQASPLRQLISQAGGEHYEVLRSLEEAQKDPEGVVILEGDEGGTIYAVCPARLVHCSQETLEHLLRDVDALVWDDPTMARIYFERRSLGATIPGGRGGGLVTGDVWVHNDLQSVAHSIRAVITGTQDRLSRLMP